MGPWPAAGPGFWSPSELSTLCRRPNPPLVGRNRRHRHHHHHHYHYHHHHHHQHHHHHHYIKVTCKTRPRKEVGGVRLQSWGMLDKKLQPTLISCACQFLASSHGHSFTVWSKVSKAKPEDFGEAADNRPVGSGRGFGVCQSPGRFLTALGNWWCAGQTSAVPHKSTKPSDADRRQSLVSLISDKVQQSRSVASVAPTLRQEQTVASGGPSMNSSTLVSFAPRRVLKVVVVST